MIGADLHTDSMSDQFLTSINQTVTSTKHPLSSDPLMLSGGFLMSSSEPFASASQPLILANEPLAATNCSSSPPSTLTSQPFTSSSQPLILTSQPFTSSSQPPTLTSQPFTSSSQPLTLTSQSFTSSSQPLTSSSQLLISASQPVASTSLPLTSSSQSLASSNQPLISASQPITCQHLTLTNQPTKDLSFEFGEFQGSSTEQSIDTLTSDSNWASFESAFSSNNTTTQGAFTATTVSVNSHTSGSQFAVFDEINLPPTTTSISSDNNVANHPEDKYAVFNAVRTDDPIVSTTGNEENEFGQFKMSQPLTNSQDAVKVKHYSTQVRLINISSHK